MADSLEIKLKVTAEGQAALDTVAKSVAAVGQATGLTGNQLNLFNATLKTLVASGQTTQQALQGMAASAGALGPLIAQAAQATLTQATASQAAAAAAQAAAAAAAAAGAAAGGAVVPTLAYAGAQQQLANAMHGQVSQLVATGAAFRELEGNMSIRAVEQYAVRVLGLGSAFQNLFPIVGAIAFAEILFKVGEVAYKAGNNFFYMRDAMKAVEEVGRTMATATETAIDQQQKLAVKTLRNEGKNVEAAQLERLQLDSRTIRPPTLSDKQIKDLSPEEQTIIKDAQSEVIASGVSERIKQINKQMAALQGEIKTIDQGGFDPTGLNTHFRSQASTTSDALANLKQFFEEQQRLGSAQGKEGDSEIEKAQRDAAKKDAKAAKPINAERIALQNELANLQANELMGLDKINAKRDAMIQHLTEEKKLNAENLALVMQIATVENQLGFSKALEVAKRNAAGMSSKAVSESDSDILKADKFNIGNLESALKKSITTGEKDVASALKVMLAGDATDADAVRHGLQTTIRGTGRAAGNGQITPGAASADNYQARVAAAQEIFTIEARHLDQIDDAGKREDALATARKKYADEIFQAEAQHTEDLAAMRQKSLEEYKTFAVGLFNAGLAGNGAPQQFLKGFGKQILDKAVGNAAGLTFDTVTKSLPQIPGQTNQQGGLTTLGKILQGTPVGTKGEDKGVAATTHLTTSTDTLRTSVDKLTAVMQGRGSGGSGGSGVGGSGGGLPSFGGIGDGISEGDAGVMTGDIGDGLPMSTGPYGATAAGNQSGPVSMPGSGLSGIGGKVAAGAAIGGGALQAFSGFEKGGAKGITSGIGGVLTTGAGIAAMFGPAGAPVALGLGIAAGAVDLLSSFLGDSKQQREKSITSHIAQDAYLAPTALNLTQSGNGNLKSFDARGNLNTSSLSAMPSILEPYITSKRLNGTNTFYDAPGSTGGPNGSAGGNGVAPTSNAGITIHINAIDTQTGVDFLMKNHMAVGEALATHLQSHEGRASNAIRFVAQ